MTTMKNNDKFWMILLFGVILFLICTKSVRIGEHIYYSPLYLSDAAINMGEDLVCFRTNNSGHILSRTTCP